ncbi:hypothetical protein GmHk_15G043895 [Glycine max]|nr:hypothetical protein GmHk_15G043895 [Glycine max]
MHTSGFISLQNHVIHLSEELGRSANVDEVFSKLIYKRILEEFETKLSQVRYNVTSSVGESQFTPLDPAEEKRLRTQCWIAVVGPKHKGRLYGIKNLVHSYKCGDENFMQHRQ